jgi:hypothetical protein
MLVTCKVGRDRLALLQDDGARSEHLGAAVGSGKPVQSCSNFVSHLAFLLFSVRTLDGDDLTLISYD